MADPIVPTPDPNPAPAWHAGLDAELIGHAQTKGWNLADAKLAFTDAARAYRGAEQYVGVPADQVLKLTKNADGTITPGPDVWERLGAPKEAKDYTFDGVELGTPEQTAAFHEAVRKTAAELRVPKAMAERLVQDIHKFQKETGDAAEVARATAVAAEKDKLQAGWKDADGNIKAGWGPNMEANMFVAKQAASALGVTPEEITALEGQIGYARVMELFRSIGSRMGEDKFITAPNGGSKTMTREQAQLRYREVMGDPMRPGSGDSAWQKRYREGGRTSAEFKELQGLLTLIG